MTKKLLFFATLAATALIANAGEDSTDRWGAGGTGPGFWATPLAAQARANRQPADAANPLLQAERSASRQVSQALELWRFAADRWNEWAFSLLYGRAPALLARPD